MKLVQIDRMLRSLGKGLTAKVGGLRVTKVDRNTFHGSLLASGNFYLIEGKDKPLNRSLATKYLQKHGKFNAEDSTEAEEDPGEEGGAGQAVGSGDGVRQDLSGG